VEECKGKRSEPCEEARERGMGRGEESMEKWSIKQVEGGNLELIYFSNVPPASLLIALHSHMLNSIFAVQQNKINLRPFK